MYPFSLTDTIKSIAVVCLVLLFAFTGSKIVDHIKDLGRAEVLDHWNQEKLSTKKKVEELQTKLDIQTTKHRQEQQEIADEIAASKIQHERDLAKLASDYSGRLRSSEMRAELYRRQAQSGSIEQDDLASHAAQLDRSLEEGRSLVRELRETLGFRDQQIQSLSRQIYNDRALLEDASQ